MKSNIFLAALPSYDNRISLTQKIHLCEAKRSPLVRVQWTATQDIHVTLGYIPMAEENDIRAIALALSSVSQNSPFMVNGEEIRLYGNALVLRLEPYQHLLNMHKKMNQKLMESTQQQYSFQVKTRFEPHLTVGRIRNLSALNAGHKHQLLALIAENFKNTSFLVQQAALLRRVPQPASVYQILQLYPLKG